MIVTLMIAIMTSTIIGISLVPIFLEPDTVAEVATESSLPVDLLSVIMIIFATIIILAAVAWMGFSGHDKSKEQEEREKATLNHIMTFIKEHKKRLIAGIITSSIMFFLWLSTIIL